MSADDTARTSIPVRVTGAEKKLVDAAAARAGLSRNAYVRMKLGLTHSKPKQTKGH